MLKISAIIISLLCNFSIFAMNKPYEVRVNKIINSSAQNIYVAQSLFNRRTMTPGEIISNTPFYITDKRALEISITEPKRIYRVALDVNKARIFVENKGTSQLLDELPLSNVTAIDIYIDPANKPHLFFAEKK